VQDLGDFLRGRIGFLHVVRGQERKSAITS
jgi:hypothetical protein